MTINDLFFSCLNNFNKAKTIVESKSVEYTSDYRTIQPIFPIEEEKNNIINKNIIHKNNNNKEIENNKIPKIMYKTGKENKNNLSPYLKKLFINFLNENKDFKLKYYDDNECKEFIARYFEKDVIEAYNKLKPGAYKADLFRYCILYINGGVYGDLSQIYHKPLIKFIDFDKDELYVIEDTIHNPYYETGIQISFIAAKPKLEIFKNAINGIIENVKNNYYGYNTLDVTGPYHFAKYLKGTNIKYKKELYLVDGDKICNKKTDEIIISSYHPEHRSVIKHGVNHYTYMWYNRDIYNN